MTNSLFILKISWSNSMAYKLMHPELKHAILL